jgi:hypothetical protein
MGTALFAGSRGATALPPPPFRFEWAERLVVREAERDPSLELCEPMPAPKRAPDEPPPEEGPAPVCLACARGRAYSLAAGEPGSMCTPGSRATAAGNVTVAASVESSTKFTHRATDTRTTTRIAEST